MRSKGDIIVCIKSNGFCDIISSDIEISDNYIDLESIESLISDFDDCIIKISKLKIIRDRGQMGEYGRWEIKPYYYIGNCNIKILVDIEGFTTKSEKDFKNKFKSEKRASDLQKFVSDLSTDTENYSLCSVWGIDGLCLYEKSGDSFSVYKKIIEFDSKSTSYKNIKNIKTQILNYLTSKNK